MECEYCANLSLAIQRTDQACNDVRKALEIATRNNDPEASAVLKDTLLIHQKAVVDMTKEKMRHKATCDSCRAA